MSLGLYFVFGVLLAPLYVVLAGWILGKPRDFRTVALGLAILVLLLLSPVIFSVVPIGTRLLIP